MAVQKARFNRTFVFFYLVQVRKLRRCCSFPCEQGSFRFFVFCTDRRALDRGGGGATQLKKHQTAKATAVANVALLEREAEMHKKLTDTVRFCCLSCKKTSRLTSGGNRSNGKKNAPAGPSRPPAGKRSSQAMHQCFIYLWHCVTLPGEGCITTRSNF